MAEGKSCYICNSTEHLRKDCPNKDSQPRSEGRKCFNCGQVGHVSAACTNGANPRPKRCYTCGGDHLARDCPEGGDGQQRSSPRENGAPRRQPKGIKCYNCGKVGHISKECPNAEQGPVCYNCQDFGHISSACPKAPAQEVQQ